VGLIKEFREFAVKGNVIDLAVGVIIGGAFGKIVTSVVEDLVMPPIGILLGKVDFTSLFVVLPGQQDKLAKLKPADELTQAKAKELGIATFNYGSFLNNVLQFLVIAFAVFLMVKAINRARSRFEPATPSGEPVTKQCGFCLSDIPTHAVKCKFCTSDLG